MANKDDLTNIKLKQGAAGALRKLRDLVVQQGSQSLPPVARKIHAERGGRTSPTALVEVAVLALLAELEPAPAPQEWVPRIAGRGSVLFCPVAGPGTAFVRVIGPDGANWYRLPSPLAASLFARTCPACGTPAFGLATGTAMGLLPHLQPDDAPCGTLQLSPVVRATPPAELLARSCPEGDLVPVGQ